MVGNFIGDFVKGRNISEQFDPEIACGIALHRAIDEFTDTHPVVAVSKNRLRPTYRHYSAVIVDMFYDHLLAANWEDYYKEFLPDFAERSYRTLEKFHSILPEGVKYMLPYMMNGNWLVNYARLEGIASALSGMARRSKYESKMELAVEDLKKNYEDFGQEFSVFYPELQAFSENWLKQETGEL